MGNLATLIPETTPVELMGRDEMNLAEFPITLLTDRAPAGQKTIQYVDRHGKLTITGSDAYGLPTAADADVIVALIHLSKMRNNFAEPIVNFTRYELLKILNWQDIGKSYHRLSESLNRWATVSLRYQGVWWNSLSRRKVSVTMHILESVILYDRTDGANQALLPLSSFTWNRTFLESCQAGNLKRLDLGVYFSLSHPTSKRLYRFLDKRLYANADQTFPLEEIAFTRVGLSPNYAGNAGKLKEKLQPAIDELENIGFLKPMSRGDRYAKQDRQWVVRFVKSEAAQGAADSVRFPGEEATEAAPSPLVAELIGRGVSAKVAADLVEKYPVETIEAKIEQFDWEMKQPKPPKRPGGYLVSSICDDYPAPKGFVTKAEQQRQEEARQTKARQDQVDRRRKQEKGAREKAEWERINIYWEALTKDAQAELQAAADSQGDPVLLASEIGPLQRLGQQIRREAYIRQLLQIPPSFIE